MAEHKATNKFGEWVKRGFLLYKENFLVLIVATFIAVTLSAFVAGLFTGPMFTGIIVFSDNAAIQLLIGFLVFAIAQVSFAILGGPLLAGLAILMLGILDGKQPKPGIADLFKGFQFFLASFLFLAVWSILNVALHGLAPLILSPVLLPLVPVVVSVAVGTLSMFGLFLIVDKNRSFVHAFQESIRLVGRRFWLYAAVVLLSSVLGMVGLLACGVGVIVTMPMYYCILAVVYRDAVKAGG